MTLSFPDEKIVAMDVWHCALPVNSRRDHGIGAVSGLIEIIVLRLTGESGAQGFGEASPWSVFTGTPEASYAALSRYFRPLVVGRKVAELHDIMAAARRIVVHCTEAKAALETALLDLAGRCLKQPVWAFLGEKKQPKIPLSCSIANPDFDADKVLLQRLENDQVGIVKLKTGFKGPAFDLMRLDYIRTHHPDMKIRVDYNQGLTREAAFEEVPKVAGFAPDFIEQPVAANDFETMARLRDMIDVPLLADESVFGPEDLERAAAEGICDGVSIKLMKAGGLFRSQETARLANEKGLLAYGGDMFESGLAHLAGAHMIAATPEITLGCEFYQARYFLLEDILEGAFPARNGYVEVPDGPGLGFVPNIEKIRKYAFIGPQESAA